MSENGIDNKELLDSDKFWSENPSILFQKNRLIEFFPMSEMTLVEKLNAITRLGIYLGVILYFATGNYLYLFITIIIGAFTLFIFKTQMGNMELYFNSYNSQTNKNNKRVLEEKPCTKPTTNNPFMNFNIITDKRDKEPACKSWDSKKIQKQVENKFGYNLYRDVSDLYNKSNSQRQYYTMPSTTMPNDQTAFAKWCYNTGPTCKEKTLYCAPIYTPINNTSNVQEFVPKLA